MGVGKIVVICSPFDQGDILRDYISWHLDLGVDHILVQDCGSTDGSQAMLDEIADGSRVRWFPLPERDMQKYASDVALPPMAIEEYGADWIIFCDVDEFLCPPSGGLRRTLEQADAQDITVINVPRFNMTGPVPQPGESALESLTLRIDRQTPVDEERYSGLLPVPHIFCSQGPKTIVKAKALTGYAVGTHAASAAWGKSEEIADLRFLHYPIRGFDKLQEKTRNAKAWLDDNPHLHPVWGWHWRRMVRLNEQGRLREDYESQLVSPADGRRLVFEGVCSVDRTVSNWIKLRRVAEAGSASDAAGAATQDSL